ncbi:MAG: hypothetical protein RL562_2700 [Planctomycetota bacterium]
MPWIDTASAWFARTEPQQAGPRPGLFERLAEEPALLELACLAALGLLGGWVVLRLRARVRAFQEAQALGDLAFGLALAEDKQWSAALPRLEQALLSFPARPSLRLARAQVLTALGRSGEAHAEHLALRRLGGLGSPRNEEGLRVALQQTADGATQSGPGPKPRSAASGAFRAVSVAARAAPVVAGPGPIELRRLEDLESLWNGIRADPDHVKRLCAAPGPHHVEDVAALGAGAAPSLLRAALEGGDRAHLASLVAALGPAIGPALLEAGRGMTPFPAEELRFLLSALGVRGVDGLSVQLANSDRRVRHVLIDVHLALADVTLLDRVLDAVPLVDVVQRCNELPEHVLVPFLAALPEEHFAFEILLPDGGFVRDRAVLRAIPTARAPLALEGLLTRRGAARSLCTELVLALVDPERSAVAERLLDRFGEHALGPLVLAFADAEQASDVRQAVRRRLVMAGPAAVRPLCACFGAHPTELDADVIAALAAIGDVGVPILRDTCLERGLLGRLNPGSRRRGVHRRAMVVRVLGAIGTMQARAALTTIRAHETDSEVLLQIARALHILDVPGRTLPSPGPEPSSRSPAEGPPGGEIHG